MTLPGVTTVLRDRFYSLSRTDIPLGPITLIIATRTVDQNQAISGGKFTVPDFDPYFAVDEKDVIDNFGNGSGAHRAFLETISAGAQRIYLVGVPTGTSQSNLFSTAGGNVLDTAFDAAETVQPDIIALWGRGGHPSEWEVPATPGDEPIIGFYADNNTAAATSMVKRVADHCADITNRSHPVTGIIGCAPYVNTANTSSTMSASQIASQVAFPNLKSRNDNDFGGNGMYVNVVGTEIIPLGYPIGFGYANGACTYAGAISQLHSWSAPTGKVLFNVSGIRYSPTRTQQQAMIDKCVMPVASDFNRVPRWVDAATFAPTASDYARLSTMRITFDAVLMVRQVGQQFIGEGSTLQARNALETAIASGLKGMQQAGALLGSDFNVSYLPAQNLATVDLVLRPAFEIRNIEVTVSLQL